jgi:hypothetical protein
MRDTIPNKEISALTTIFECYGSIAVPRSKAEVKDNNHTSHGMKLTKFL